MPVKTLKIKRVFAWAIYNNLRNIPPKEYPTTAEIKNTIGEVLPALKAHLGSYIELMARASALQEQVTAAPVDQREAKVAELQPAVEKVNEEWKENNRVQGPEVVDIQLEGEAFKTLHDQFNRDGWGKNWIATIEEFGELLAIFEEVAKA